MTLELPATASNPVLKCDSFHKFELNHLDQSEQFVGVWATHKGGDGWRFSAQRGHRQGTAGSCGHSLSEYSSHVFHPVLVISAMAEMLIAFTYSSCSDWALSSSLPPSCSAQRPGRWWWRPGRPRPASWLSINASQRGGCMHGCFHPYEQGKEEVE